MIENPVETMAPPSVPHPQPLQSHIFAFYPPSLQMCRGSGLQVNSLQHESASMSAEGTLLFHSEKRSRPLAPLFVSTEAFLMVTSQLSHQITHQKLYIYYCSQSIIVHDQLFRRICSTQHLICYKVNRCKKGVFMYCTGMSVTCLLTQAKERKVCVLLKRRTYL